MLQHLSDLIGQHPNCRVALRHHWPGPHIHRAHTDTSAAPSPHRCKVYGGHTEGRRQAQEAGDAGHMRASRVPGVGASTNSAGHGSHPSPSGQDGASGTAAGVRGGSTSNHTAAVAAAAQTVTGAARPTLGSTPPVRRGSLAPARALGQRTASPPSLPGQKAVPVSVSERVSAHPPHVAGPPAAPMTLLRSWHTHGSTADADADADTTATDGTAVLAGAVAPHGPPREEVGAALPMYDGPGGVTLLPQPCCPRPAGRRRSQHRPPNIIVRLRRRRDDRLGSGPATVWGALQAKTSPSLSRSRSHSRSRSSSVQPGGVPRPLAMPTTLHPTRSPPAAPGVRTVMAPTWTRCQGVVERSCEDGAGVGPVMSDRPTSTLGRLPRDSVSDLSGVGASRQETLPSAKAVATPQTRCSVAAGMATTTTTTITTTTTTAMGASWSELWAPTPRSVDGGRGSPPPHAQPQPLDRVPPPTAHGQAHTPDVARSRLQVTDVTAKRSATTGHVYSPAPPPPPSTMTPTASGGGGGSGMTVVNLTATAGATPSLKTILAQRHRSLLSRKQQQQQQQQDDGASGVGCGESGQLNGEQATQGMRPAAEGRETTTASRAGQGVPTTAPRTQTPAWAPQQASGLPGRTLTGRTALDTNYSEVHTPTLPTYALGEKSAAYEEGDREEAERTALGGALASAAAATATAAVAVEAVSAVPRGGDDPRESRVFGGVRAGRSRRPRSAPATATGAGCTPRSSDRLSLRSGLPYSPGRLQGAWLCSQSCTPTPGPAALNVVAPAPTTPTTTTTTPTATTTRSERTSSVGERVGLLCAHPQRRAPPPPPERGVAVEGSHVNHTEDRGYPAAEGSHVDVPLSLQQQQQQQRVREPSGRTSSTAGSESSTFADTRAAAVAAYAAAATAAARSPHVSKIFCRYQFWPAGVQRMPELQEGARCPGMVRFLPPPIAGMVWRRELEYRSQQREREHHGKEQQPPCRERWTGEREPHDAPLPEWESPPSEQGEECGGMGGPYRHAPGVTGQWFTLDTCGRPVRMPDLPATAAAAAADGGNPLDFSDFVFCPFDDPYHRDEEALEMLSMTTTSSCAFGAGVEGLDWRAWVTAPGREGEGSGHEPAHGAQAGCGGVTESGPAWTPTRLPSPPSPNPGAGAHTPPQPLRATPDLAREQQRQRQATYSVERTLYGLKRRAARWNSRLIRQLVRESRGSVTPAAAAVVGVEGLDHHQHHSHERPAARVAPHAPTQGTVQPPTRGEGYPSPVERAARSRSAPAPSLPAPWRSPSSDGSAATTTAACTRAGAAVGCSSSKRRAAQVARLMSAGYAERRQQPVDVDPVYPKAMRKRQSIERWLRQIKMNAPGLTQNQGNILGDRPCVRQSRLYREGCGGNAMKELLGQGSLKWDTTQTEGAYKGGRVYDHNTDDGMAVVGGQRPAPHGRPGGSAPQQQQRYDEVVTGGMRVYTPNRSAQSNHQQQQHQQQQQQQMRGQQQRYEFQERDGNVQVVSMDDGDDDGYDERDGSKQQQQYQQYQQQPPHPQQQQQQQQQKQKLDSPMQTSNGAYGSQTRSQGQQQQQQQQPLPEVRSVTGRGFRPGCGEANKQTYNIFTGK